MIYFVQLYPGSDADPVKIGCAGNVYARLRMLQTAHPEDLVVRRVIKGDFRTEAELHLRFEKYHIRGEWFRFHPQMMTIGTEQPWHMPKRGVPALVRSVPRATPLSSVVPLVNIPLPLHEQVVAAARERHVTPDTLIIRFIKAGLGGLDSAISPPEPPTMPSDPEPEPPPLPSPPPPPPFKNGVLPRAPVTARSYRRSEAAA